ncbi:glycosyl hydrolase family 8 [Vibrio sp. vnigr-6D03]|uniref:glycosyl hydrolase family 8 n=1 Tax=Vibrio sp. vnigr-6D03 TaxID=2058088 RepID=UPI001F014434|nr:glycosyl hydrolase family 8 [Vibrio sp. vnigr-6D03]
MRIKRSILVLSVLSSIWVSSASFASSQCHSDQSMWSTYKSSFITRNGRVIDNANKHISHSEGQGYGMLIAEYFGDQKTFRKLWSWTQKHLSRDQDPLFSWKWQSNPPHVPDKNNASDGDILIAWALLRASKRWPGHGYQSSAKEIIQELQHSHLKSRKGEVVLLPGSYGFEFSRRTVVNPAYWVFPAFDDFSQYSDQWKALSESGVAMLNANLYGHHLLPPDWLEVSKNGWKPAQNFPPQFSYSSYRVPLHLVWGGRSHRINWLYNNWLESSNKAWVDVTTGELAPYPPPEGATAIAQLVERASKPSASQKGISVHPKGKDYYSDSLVLLSHIAYNERICQ